MLVPVGFLEQGDSVFGSGGREQAELLLVLARRGVDHPADVPGKEGRRLLLTGASQAVREVADR